MDRSRAHSIYQCVAVRIPHCSSLACLTGGPTLQGPPQSFPCSLTRFLSMSTGCSGHVSPKEYRALTHLSACLPHEARGSLSRWAERQPTTGTYACEPNGQRHRHTRTHTVALWPDDRRVLTCKWGSMAFSRSSPGSRHLSTGF